MKILKFFLIMLALILLISSPGICKNFSDGYDASTAKTIINPLRYQILFFRNGGRVWIVLPPRTAFVEIYSSLGIKKGWVKAYNKWRQPLVLDNFFHGEATISNPVRRSRRPYKLIVSLHDKRAVGIYTPLAASYVEIINARNGFDGVVNVYDKRKRILNRQTGVDIRIVNYH